MRFANQSAYVGLKENGVVGSTNMVCNTLKPLKMHTLFEENPRLKMSSVSVNLSGWSDKNY